MKRLCLFGLLMIFAVACGGQATAPTGSNPTTANSPSVSPTIQADVEPTATVGTRTELDISDDQAQSGDVDITGITLTNTSANCADYAATYLSHAHDVGHDVDFTGHITIEVHDEGCTIQSNAIPNHDFNDRASGPFANAVTEQDQSVIITANPQLAESPTPISAEFYDAILLNGVKVDLISAGCYGVGNGTTGCFDMSIPWRYDPMSPLSNFRTDSHNAHAQPSGEYHYHGNPNALFDSDDASAVSPVIGFAADGFPIFGSYIDDNGTIREVQSSYVLREGERDGGPGGEFDGAFIDDFEYVEGHGDLDECNGMTVNGVYGYYVTDGYPHILACFRGTPHPSFSKRNDGNANADATNNENRGNDRGGAAGQGQGQAPETQQRGGGNLDAAAEQLGISVAELQSALGTRPYDFGAAATTLNVDEGVLREVVQGQRGNNRPNNPATPDEETPDIEEEEVEEEGTIEEDSTGVTSVSPTTETANQYRTTPFNQSPQNVILIIADDYGIDKVGLYNEDNSHLPLTPNIDALQESGVLFNNAWVNPICSPTRATMLTGRYGFRTGIGDIVGNEHQHGIDLSEFTLPMALDAGSNSTYAHANIGKWHLSTTENGGNENPYLMGYDHYSGIIRGGVRDYYAWDQVSDGSTQTLNETYVTTALVDESIEWVETQETEETPWFLWLALTAPHAPFHLPPAHLHSYGELSGSEDDVAAQPSAYYAAMVEAMDTEIGRLLDSLPEDVRAETTVIFIGDNGTPRQVLEPTLGNDQGKGSLFEGGVRVPLIISSPLTETPGRSTDALVNGVDMFATVLELAGIEMTGVLPNDVTVDAVSMVPYLTNRSQTSMRDIIYSEAFNGVYANSVTGSTVRDEQYHLIRYENGDEALYDLANDAYETNNLLDGLLSEPEQAAYCDLYSNMIALLSTETGVIIPAQPLICSQ